MATVEAAMRLMARAHAGQRRRDGSPYYLHCTRVKRILQDEIGNKSPVAAAVALTHDVIEKTQVNRDELETEVGSEVTAGVLALSKPYKSTTHGEAKTAANLGYYKTTLAALSVDLQQVKIADRVDNLRSMEGCDLLFQDRQLRDTENMIVALGSVPGVDLLREELRLARDRYQQQSAIASMTPNSELTEKVVIAP